MTASGIDVKRTKIAVYTLSGTMAGIAGVVMAAAWARALRLCERIPLAAIACIVVGGTAITGGVVRSGGRSWGR